MDQKTEGPGYLAPPGTRGVLTPGYLHIFCFQMAMKKSLSSSFPKTQTKTNQKPTSWLRRFSKIPLFLFKTTKHLVDRPEANKCEVVSRQLPMTMPGNNVPFGQTKWGIWEAKNPWAINSQSICSHNKYFWFCLR